MSSNKNINWIPKPVAFVAKRLQQSTPSFSTSYVGRYSFQIAMEQSQ